MGNLLVTFLRFIFIKQSAIDNDAEDTDRFIGHLSLWNNNILLNFSKDNLIDIGKNDITCNSRISNTELKSNCKIFKISYCCDIEELSKILELNSKEYNNLLIFIITVENLEFMAENKTFSFFPKDKASKINLIKESLLKFGENRPLILQVTSEDNKMTKLYYKDESTEHLIPVDQQRKGIENFPSFLCSILSNSFIDANELEAELTDKLQQINNSSLVLRFSRNLCLSENFYKNALDKLSQIGTAADLDAILDVSFNNLVPNKSIEYLTHKIESPAAKDESNKEEICFLCPSILLTAIMNLRTNVTKHIILNFTHHIKQLSFKHQLEISSTAYDTNQIDILCDLLTIADFPFPKHFDVPENERFKAIVKERDEFEAAIMEQSVEKMTKFIENNLNHKFVYNTKNQSALMQALSSSKYTSYGFLRSHGYEASEFKKPDEILKGGQLNIFARHVRQYNIQNATPDPSKSILLLRMRSSIHNLSLCGNKEGEYREKIKKWFEDISEIPSGQELLYVASSCDQLKIIFDFHNRLDEEMTLSYGNSLGSMYPGLRCIFVGAKYTDENGKESSERDQDIKGVIAHELCHFALKLVYENHENPYYDHQNELRKKFENIVKTIDKWSKGDRRADDDNCSGIISTVFKSYYEKDFHPELIVRPVHIFAQYANDPVKIEELQQLYKILFDFWFNNVVPDLKNFNLKIRDDTQKLNNRCELLSNISSLKIKFTRPEDMETLLGNNLSIVSANVPKLTLCNIYSHLQTKQGDLLNAQNVFFEPSKMKKQSQNFADFQKLLSNHQNLNVIIDCSKEPEAVGTHIIRIVKTYIIPQFIFIFSDEPSSQEQKKSLIEALNENKFQPELISLNYSWSDLTDKSQKSLMQIKISFQNENKITLWDLLKEDISHIKQISTSLIEEYERNQLTGFSDIIDSNMLNALMERQQLTININVQNLIQEENFSILYQAREFIKKESATSLSKNAFLSIDQLHEETKDSHYVLISDKAGTGKSWAMKKVTYNLLTLKHKRWVSYIDLKQFIDEFLKCKEENTIFDCASFIAENILNKENKQEINVFKRLYKNGKVTLLFDGFDEIAPDYATIVSNLAKSFKLNGGNQLWIATRDYFDVDLKANLNLNISYGLDEFTAEDGFNLIATSWLIKDSKETNLTKAKVDEMIKESTKFKEYQQQARVIVDKVKIIESRSIGLPQLFKMIIETFKDSDVSKTDFRGITVYEKFMKNLCMHWSHYKGKCRAKDSVEAQQYRLNFWLFHQFLALQNSFPKKSKFCYLIPFDCEWSVDAIIVGCGILNKRIDKINFVHETYREFFIAYFIAKIIKNQESYTDFFEIIVNVLSRKEFIMVQIFLNDAVEDIKKLEIYQSGINDYFEHINDMDCFAEYFTRNLENLVDIVITALKTRQYEFVKGVLFKDAAQIVQSTSNENMFLKFQTFLLETINNEDELKELIEKAEIFLKLIQSKLDMKIFDGFLTKVADRTGLEFIKNGLKIGSRENLNGNIFHYLCLKSNLAASKVQEFLKIIKKYLDYPEILKLMQKCNKNDQNVLQVCIRTGSPQILTSIWTGIGQFLSKADFKELVTQKTSLNWNILHYAASCEDIKFHEDLWTHLLMTFTDLKELMDLLIHDNKLTSNFTFYILESTKSAEIMELTFKILKDKSKEQFNVILQSHDQYGRNLLQIAVLRSNDIKTHEILWEYFQQACSPDQLVKVFGHTDNNGCNILHIAAYASCNKIYELIYKNLTKLPKNDEIKKLLKSTGKSQMNLLKSLASISDSVQFYETLWKILHDKLDIVDLSEMIRNKDADGYNIFFTLVRLQTKEIIELTWKEIKSILNKNEQDDYLVQNSGNGENLMDVISDSCTSTENRDCVLKILNEQGF